MWNSSWRCWRPSAVPPPIRCRPTGGDLEDFLAFLDRQAKPLAAAAPAEIGAYLRALSQSGLAPALAHAVFPRSAELFKFLVGEGVIAEDPVVGFAGPKQGRPLPRRCRSPRSIA